MPESVPTRGPVLVDGLIVRSDGWTGGLAASGLDAIHVTAADWVGDFADACAGVARWQAILERDAEHLFGILDAGDLAWVGADDRTGVLLGLQNAAPVGADIERVEVLWRLGVRALQLTYNEANLVGDGCIEERDAGLSRLGRRVVAECNRLGILVDLSHVGRRSALDAVAASEAPVAATHANRRALVDNPRNQTDEVLLAIAAAGGVVGVSPWSPMCWTGGGQPDVSDFVAQLLGMIELVGVDAVAIGTDLPALSAQAPGSGPVLARSAADYPEIFGAYVAAVDNTIETRYCAGLDAIDRWSELPGHLAAAGLDASEAARVLGGNWIRLLGQVLPPAAGGPQGAS